MKQRDKKNDADGTTTRRSVKHADAGPVVNAHERNNRDFLTPAEVDQLLRAAKSGRYGQRDYAMLLMASRHGFRVSELVGLTRRDVSLNEARILCARKNGRSTSQLLREDELRALQTYTSKRDDSSPWLFVSGQGGQMTRRSINYSVAKAGQRAGLGHINPSMRRHSCAYALAGRGADEKLLQALRGHLDIRHTYWYIRPSSVKFVRESDQSSDGI